MMTDFISDVTFSINASMALSIDDSRNILAPGSIITVLAKNYHGIPNEVINKFISIYEDSSLYKSSKDYNRPLFTIAGQKQSSLMYLGVKTRTLRYAGKGFIKTCFYKVLVLPTTKVFWLSEDNFRDIAIINALNEAFTWK